MTNIDLNWNELLNLLNFFSIPEPQKVVGTNYSRVIPSKEINSKDRDTFWKKEEEEERIRTEGERARQTNAKLELEKVRYFVFYFWVSISNELFHFRSKDCASNKNTLNVKKGGLKRRQKEIPMGLKWKNRRSKCFYWPNTWNVLKLNAICCVFFLSHSSIQIPKPSVDRSTTQAEEMRQQRNQEARQLIGNSVDKAKAIFAQNTAAGQLTNKSAKTAPVKPVRNSITRSTTNQRQQQSPEPEKSQQQSIEQSESPTDQSPQPSNNNLQETIGVADQPNQNLEEDDSDPYSTIKRSPYTKTNSQSELSANNKQQADNVQTEAINTQEHATEKEVAEEKPSSESGKIDPELVFEAICNALWMLEN